MIKKILTVTPLAAFSCAAISDDYSLTILHTNDIHSRIESINKYNSTCKAEDEVEGKCFGGVARIKSKMDELRRNLGNQNVLVVDAGDPFQGSLFFTTYKGKAEAVFMNSIGYDVMAVGNHEFDNGPDALAEFVDTVSFPVISGNLDLSAESRLKDRIKDNLVLEIGGEKIGIVSALAIDTPVTSSPGDKVVFQDEIESLRADVTTLQEQGVDKIIALNHVGLATDVEIAKAVPGIDVIVGGHSHTLMSNDVDDAPSYPTVVNGVPIVQAFAYSKYIGKLDIVFDDAGNVKSSEGGPVVLDSSVVPDVSVLEEVKRMAAPIEETKALVVGVAQEVINGDRSVCRVTECPMGNLVADAMLDRVKGQGVTIAIQNGGGLRASIDSGEVTMGEVLTVLPFQNTLSTFQVTGQSVIDALENGVSQVEEVKGRFPQVAGLRFTWDKEISPNEGRIQEVLVRNGESYIPIDPDSMYGVVSNNYLRNGGDGYKVFKNAKNAYDFGPDLADVLADYLRSLDDGYKQYVDGRIKSK